MEKIQELYINSLHPHPDNPRKKIGDISELTESIRKNGILQNLTVVPDKDGEYTVIIGHRRLAAAQAAGLTMLPCAIVELDDREQVLTMLEENMHREDLTPIEEAFGFQMMFDFGMSADDIAERTGFHRATVYHRLNLAKLDRDLLEKCMEDEGFQLNIRDLINLEKIENVEERNKVLEEARDSRDITARVEQIVREQNRNKAEKEYEKLLEAAGLTKAPASYMNERWSDKWETVYRFVLDAGNTEDSIKKCEYLSQAEHFVRSYNDMILIRKNKKQQQKKEKTEEDLKREREKEAQKKLSELWKQMGENRDNNIWLILKGKLVQDDYSEALEELWGMILESDSNINRRTIISFWSEKNYWELKDEEKEYFNQLVDDLPALHQMLIIANSSIKQSSFFINGKMSNKNVALRIKRFYEILEKQWSIKMTKEEEKLLNGTHEAYIQED